MRINGVSNTRFGMAIPSKEVEEVISRAYEAASNSKERRMVRQSEEIIRTLLPTTPVDSKLVQPHPFLSKIFNIPLREIIYLNGKPVAYAQDFEKNYKDNDKYRVANLAKVVRITHKKEQEWLDMFLDAIKK